MINLLIDGGILFMSILTLTLTANCGLFIYFLLKKVSDENQLAMIKSVGLFGLIFGLLGQFIGLYQALEHIAQVESVSSKILAGGIKVSSISSIYGMIIFVISYLLWFGLRLANNIVRSDN